MMAHVGEILFASPAEKRVGPKGDGKDAGLAWTRDAVELAERTFGDPDTEREAKIRCQECLDVGLENWRVMVGRMVGAEREREPARYRLRYRQRRPTAATATATAPAPAPAPVTAAAMDRIG